MEEADELLQQRLERTHQTKGAYSANIYAVHKDDITAVWKEFWQPSAVRLATPSIGSHSLSMSPSQASAAKSANIIPPARTEFVKWKQFLSEPENSDETITV